MLMQQLATMHLHFMHVMHMPAMCMVWRPDASILSKEDEYFFAKHQNNASC